MNELSQCDTCNHAKREGQRCKHCHERCVECGYPAERYPYCADCSQKYIPKLLRLEKKTERPYKMYLHNKKRYDMDVESKKVCECGAILIRKEDMHREPCPFCSDFSGCGIKNRS